jgi:YceI-like domain
MTKCSYFLLFDKLQGELHYRVAQPEHLRLTVAIDASTVACRTGALRVAQRQRCAREQVSQAGLHPTIHFASSRTTPKALRGLVVEGTLQVRGTTCVHKLNLVITPTGVRGSKSKAIPFCNSPAGVSPSLPRVGVGLERTRRCCCIGIYMRFRCGRNRHKRRSPMMWVLGQRKGVCRSLLKGGPLHLTFLAADQEGATRKQK